MIGNGSFKCSQVFSINDMNSLQCLEIGNYCFIKVVRFIINGLNKLKHLMIGKNSFTLIDSLFFDSDPGEAVKHSCNRDRSFQILNCESLESIQIGQFSFFDYAGSFFLSNLPSLQLIDIGLNDYPSANFVRSSFVVRGIFYSF